MPYNIVMKNGKHCVVKKADGRMVKGGCHDTKDQARNHMAALYANETDMNAKAIFLGGELKALDENGKIGGYGVLFTSAEDPDIMGDYFTKSTDFFMSEDGESPVLVIYHHGQDPVLKAKMRKQGTAKVDEVGIWVEAQLDVRNKYEKAILALVKAGKLGWSTGSAPHLVERDEVKAGVFEIKSWPIFEASITPVPIEPRSTIMSIKSYTEFTDSIDDRDAELKAVWTTAYVNSLPDSCFGYIDPEGGRHFPYKDKEGNPDAAHVRNALARIPQSKVSDAGKAEALRKIQAAAKKMGMDVAMKKSLAERLTQYLTDLVDDGQDRESIVKALAGDAFMEIDQVEEVLGGKRRPSTVQLKSFARTLRLDFDMLKELHEPPAEKITIKGLFEDALTAKQFRTWELWSTFSDVITQLVTVKAGTMATGVEFDFEGKLNEAADEYKARLIDTINRQVDEYMQDSASGMYPDDKFYLRALGDPTQEDFVLAKSVDIDDHAQLAVAAFKSIDKRFRLNYAKRSAEKAGRQLSKPQYAKYKALLDELTAKIKDGYAFLEIAKPLASEDATRAATAEFLRSQLETDILEREITEADIANAV